MTMCNGKNLLKGTICIRGLRKYLLKVDTLQLTFKIGDICNIFDVWDVIQKELVDMSQFYSLIDIYGHYANRGDTVKVSTLFQEIPDNETLIKEINFFRRLG